MVLHACSISSQGLPPAQRPGEVRVERGLFRRRGAGRVAARGYERVVVDRHQVEVLGPASMIDRHPVAEHEVGGHRDVRCHCPQYRPLFREGCEHLSGDEPAKVQILRGVDQVLGCPGREDLLPGAVPLPPERGRPGPVQFIQSGVPLTQPPPEGRCGMVAVARGAVLVVHVPQGEGRMIGVALGEHPGDPGTGFAVRGCRDAVGVPAAVQQSGAVRGHRQRVRVGKAEPGGWGCGRRRHGDADPTSVQPIKHPVKPVKSVFSRLRLNRCPRKNPETDQVDPGLSHQDDILVPDFFRPLLRVVVSTKTQSRNSPWPAHATSPQIDVCSVSRQTKRHGEPCQRDRLCRPCR